MKATNLNFVSIKPYTRPKFVSTGSSNCWEDSLGDMELTKSSSLDRLSLEGSSMFTEYLAPVESEKSTRILVETGVLCDIFAS